KLLEECKQVAEGNTMDGGRDARPTIQDMLQRAVEVTDMNAAVFDAANNFKGVIAGVHEVLRRQGLLEGIWCLNPDETLGKGQVEQLDRVIKSYPHLIDDAFIAENLDKWLS